MAAVSVPSWVIPGTYAENLRFLETRKEVAGVELLFFLYNDEVETQLDNEWDAINAYRERFVFTAHLPDKIVPRHEKLVERLVDRLAPLVRHFVAHPDEKNPAAFAGMLKDWAGKYGAVFLLENIFTRDGGKSLDAALPHFAPDAGLCMDTGHLLLDEKSPAEFFLRYGNRVKEIHLHSLDREEAARDNRLADHRRLVSGEKWLCDLLPLLKAYQGIINLEVFSWEEAAAGIDVLKAARLI